MKLVRWSPINQMLSQWPDLWDEDIMPNPRFDNSLDVYETEDEVVVKANVAGVKDDDVDITFEKGILWIKASHTEEDNRDKKQYSKAAWDYSYKVSVPGTLDHSQEPNVELTNGVLKIVFKKSEGAKLKKLSIKKK